MGSYVAACGNLLYLVPMGCSGRACSITSLSYAAGNFCSVTGASPFSLLTEASLQPFTTQPLPHKPNAIT